MLKDLTILCIFHFSLSLDTIPFSLNGTFEKKSLMSKPLFIHSESLQKLCPWLENTMVDSPLPQGT